MKRIFFVLTTVVALAACNGTAKKAVEDPGFVKAHDIHQLMKVVVEPQANVFWNSSGTINDASGEHDLTPTTDEGWLATQSAAATIAEIGNLLLTPQFAEGRGKDWQQFASSLVEIGMIAEKAAADRNTDAVMESGGTMYKVCSACHQVYMPAARKVQETEGGKES